jgi:hypothetical protein
VAAGFRYALAASVAEQQRALNALLLRSKLPGGQERYFWIDSITPSMLGKIAFHSFSLTIGMSALHRQQ